jgi:hypothetical protein
MRKSLTVEAAAFLKNDTKQPAALRRSDARRHRPLANMPRRLPPLGDFSDVAQLMDVHQADQIMIARQSPRDAFPNSGFRIPCFT